MFHEVSSTPIRAKLEFGRSLWIPRSFTLIESTSSVVDRSFGGLINLQNKHNNRNQAIMNAVLKHSADSCDMEVPDLMGSSSSGWSSSSSLSSGSGTSHYMSCSNGFNSSLESNVLELDFAHYEKEIRSAEQIQAITRGFLIRLRMLKAPLLAKLVEMERCKQEELQAIELQKKKEMAVIQKQMEMEPAEGKLAEAMRLIEELKEKRAKYVKKNVKLKGECKELEKANNKMTRDAKMDAEKGSSKSMETTLVEQKVATRERHHSSQRKSADKLLKKIATKQAKLQEVIEAAMAEKEQGEKMKECISGIFVRVEARCDPLADTLMDIMYRNKVFQ